VEWLDDSEMQAQHDEDYRCSREVVNESSLHDWMHSREQQPGDSSASLQILKDPVIVNKSLGRKTVEYTIQTSVTTVKRRYRDFEALRYGLIQRFPGSVVPPLPERKQIGKLDPKFIEGRRLHLECFLRALIKNVFFGNDDMFVEFIASSSQFDRKSAMMSRKTLIKTNKLTNASKRWSQALLETESPKDPIVLLDMTIKELEVMKKSLMQTRDTLKHFGLMMTKTSEASSAVAEALLNTQTAENNYLVLNSSTAAPIQYSSLMGEIFRLNTVAMDTSSRIQQTEVNNMYETLMAPLRYEIMYVDTMLNSVRKTKSSMVKHISTIKTYREAKNQPDAAKFVGVQLGFVNDPGDGLHNDGGDGGDDDGGGGQRTRLLPPLASVEMDKTRRKLTKLRMAAVNTQRNARRDIVGTLVLALNRFRTERVERIRLASMLFAQIRTDQLGQLCATWQRLKMDLGEAAKAVIVDSTTMSIVTGTAATTTTATTTMIVPPHTTTNRITGNNPFLVGDGSLMNEPSIPTTLGGSKNIDSLPGPTTRRSSQLRAIYQFTGEHEDELTVQPGEILAGAVADEDPEWYVATSQATGKTGLVPANFVEVVGPVNNTGTANNDDGDIVEEDDANEVPPEEPDEQQQQQHQQNGGNHEHDDDDEDPEDVSDYQPRNNDRPPVTNYIQMTQQSLKHPAAAASSTTTTTSTTTMGGKKRTQVDL
jgi:hypothetical protein